jgi:hypothetical protein
VRPLGESFLDWSFLGLASFEIDKAGNAGQSRRRLYGRGFWDTTVFPLSGEACVLRLS